MNSLLKAKKYLISKKLTRKNIEETMTKLSYTLATLAVIGFSVLPANAIEKEITNNEIVTDATEQIMQSTKPQQSCCYIPYYGCLCG